MMKRLAIALVMIGLITGCDDVAREQTPVELVATFEQDVLLFDLSDAACPGPGTLLLRAIKKTDTAAPDTFLDVRLQRMRISYRRTDGGTVAPDSFVTTMSGLVPIGGDATVNSFFIFDTNALDNAPFASLVPANGGFDPETGNQIIKLDVIIEVFGETLSGEPVFGRTEFPLSVCFSCGGCVKADTGA